MAASPANGTRASRPYRRYGVCLVLLQGLFGCAGPPSQGGVGATEACRALFRTVDEHVIAAGVRDPGPHPVAGFPYLRTTRLLSSFRDEVDEPRRFASWVGHLSERDARARGHELRNLPGRVSGRDDASLAAELDRCRSRLAAADLATEDQRDRLRAAATTPDDYVTTWRILGLYPVTALPVLRGIAIWHAETRATFALPLERLPVAGDLRRWAVPADEPLDEEAIADLLREGTDPLGLPLPGPVEIRRLFERFAPIWEVDVVDDDDRIGRPSPDSVPRVDVARPTLFRRISHTRFHGRVLLQLNYIVWFPARPGDDIYSGPLDGINWRVTLGPDGEPWLYDAIHNCGCYHLFFPGPHLHLRENLPKGYFEPPMVPQPAPPGGPLVLRIAHATHFIERIYVDRGERPAQPMEWADYDQLRSLPVAGGHRSLFGRHGIVPGSERPERRLLWPMGIRSPGAMRQWLRHPTALIGRRHFDDPDLIERLFEYRP